jgi:hypothetical protein
MGASIRDAAARKLFNAKEWHGRLARLFCSKADGRDAVHGRFGETTLSKCGGHKPGRVSSPS